MPHEAYEWASGDYLGVAPAMAVPTIRKDSDMTYHIENIGSTFNDKAIAGLTSRLNANEQNGWDFHSVMMIEHRTCLGLVKTSSYLAIYRQRL